MYSYPGVDLGFSREGGGDFPKFFDLFFQINQIDFPSAPRILLSLQFHQKFCAAGNFYK